MSSEDFYKSLPALENFGDVADFSRYVPAPNEVVKCIWHP